MMAGLYFLYLISMILVIVKKRKLAIALTMVTLLLCIFMLIHHATDTLQIRI